MTFTQKMNELCKGKNIKKVAMIFVPNRFSQKLGNFSYFHNLPYQLCGTSTAMMFPFNFKKYSNPKTIIKRLKEFDYILVHETDIDVIEKLKELSIDFKVLPIEIKKLSIKYRDRPRFRSDIDYINYNFLDVYGLKEKIKKYYMLKDEHTQYPYIEEIFIKYSEKVPYYVYTSKKKLYDEYVSRLSLNISNYSETVNNMTERLYNFMQKYKKEIENE